MNRRTVYYKYMEVVALQSSIVLYKKKVNVIISSELLTVFLAEVD